MLCLKSKGFLRLALSLFMVLALLPASAAQKIEQDYNFSIVDANYKLHGEKYLKVYDKELGRSRLAKNRMIVQFKEGAYPYQIYTFLYKNNLTITDQIGEDIYLLKSSSNKREDFVETINTLKFSSRLAHEKNEIIETFDIDEYKKLKLKDIYSNTFGYKEWHLENDGVNGNKIDADIDVEDAWDFATGDGVKVAVIDTGFDTDHPDINYALEGYNALSRSKGKKNRSTSFRSASAPKLSSENHGTAVAGIIAAKDNSIGVVGVAPNSEVIPIRLMKDNGIVSISQILKAFKMADELGADIINCSWGTEDPYLRPGKVMNISDAEVKLYKKLATEGRGGKGIVMVFASGNLSGTNFDNSPEARIKEVIAVGATNSEDKRASYSTYGEELDLVAPGGEIRPIFTTDRDDESETVDGETRRYVKGYSPGYVARTFKGTSAATPIVAGVAALMLSANPNLSAKEVKEILQTTADKNTEDYSFNSKGKNPEIGYGRVNAHEAVKRSIERMYEVNLELY